MQLCWKVLGELILELIFWYWLWMVFWNWFFLNFQYWFRPLQNQYQILILKGAKSIRIDCNQSPMLRVGAGVRLPVESWSAKVDLAWTMFQQKMQGIVPLAPLTEYIDLSAPSSPTRQLTDPNKNSLPERNVNNRSDLKGSKRATTSRVSALRPPSNKLTLLDDNMLWTAGLPYKGQLGHNLWCSSKMRGIYLEEANITSHKNME